MPTVLPGPDLMAGIEVRTAARIDGAAFHTRGIWPPTPAWPSITGHSGSSIHGEHPPRAVTNSSIAPSRSVTADQVQAV
ncbi:hypothetical protein GCM10023170_057510 [Phytohabitans houttuyneae]|uniref:Uncharacterized protein n=1 Tax=Phytohabitans houttuyneae TaxID=1076126 RepID=A0A6V8K670_9ACTN|nr:hypothetical protein Phou_018190 [Phytohabitans houttuyneae]